MGLVTMVEVWVVITLLASWFRERERHREEERVKNNKEKNKEGIFN